MSRNTVKTQVAGTYRKLGAGTRAAAVERGRELGLPDLTAVCRRTPLPT